MAHSFLFSSLFTLSCFRLIYYLEMKSIYSYFRKLMQLPCTIFSTILGKTFILYMLVVKNTFHLPGHFLTPESIEFGFVCRYVEVNMDSAALVWPLFNSLQAFWPGLQVFLYTILQYWINESSIIFIN